MNASTRLPAPRKSPSPIRVVWLGALVALAVGRVSAQAPSLATPVSQTGSVTLNWQGGNGPFVVEASQDLQHWSNVGEPVAGTNRTVAATGDRAFYRVMDLDPADQLGPFVGLLQTEQGEFGDLMARHRLKSRWWFHQPTGTLSKVPATYFRNLIVHHQFLDEDRVQTVAGPIESFATVSTPGISRTLIATWSRGSGDRRRNFTLTLEFPYPVHTARAATPRLSDPEYTLRCVYATPQPVFDLFQMSVETTLSESINLIELAPPESQSWFTQDYTVTDRGVQARLSFREGNYLRQGEPLWILKTAVLHEWTAPSVISGGSVPGFTTDSYFSRTLLPGHHNFVETVLLEPAVDPSVSEATRAALAAANLRYLHTYKDLLIGMSPDDIRLIGFDNTLRDP